MSYPCRDCGGRGYVVRHLDEDAGTYEAVCDLCKGSKRVLDNRGLERRASDRPENRAAQHAATRQATLEEVAQKMVETKSWEATRDWLTSQLGGDTP